MRRTARKAFSALIHRLLRGRPGLAETIAANALEIRYEMPVPPTHYYSPLPDIPELKEERDRWWRPGALAGLGLELAPQETFLENLRPYREESERLPPLADVKSRGFGEGYGEIEARWLYATVRYLKPGRIVEVGSGVSTWYAAEALNVNERDGKDRGELICIEPHPSEALIDFVAENDLTLYDVPVQEVETAVFEALGHNDVLFIDSTHVSKIGSDVNRIYLELLPALGRGVVVHVHDIPFPYLTLPPDHPLFTHSLLWNEAALVKAFLLFNQTFEVLVCQSYLHFARPEAIRELIGIYDPDVHFPTSLWLRKKS